MMKKITAVLLAAVLAACVSLAAADVSADEINFLRGKSYTVTFYDADGNVTDDPGIISAACKDTVPPSLLTDGAYRGDGVRGWNGLSAAEGVSLEFFGSGIKTGIDFAFDSPVSIGTIVVRRVRCFFLDNSVNRFARIAGIRTSTDGTAYRDVAFTDCCEPAADAPEYRNETGQTGPQFFDLTAAITGGAANVKGLRLLLDTKFPDSVPRIRLNPATNLPYESGYVLQLDEIEAYAPGVPPAASEPSEPPAASESSDAPTNPRRVNLTSGRPYTLSCDDGNPDFISPACPDPERKLLTDGRTRLPSQLTPEGAGTGTVTVEFTGTNRTHCADISLDGLSTVDSVILDVVRRSDNRYANVPKIEVRADGVWRSAAFTGEACPIQGAPLYYPGEDAEGRDQFFTLEYVLGSPAENVTDIRVYFNTDPGGGASGSASRPSEGRAYIVQLDEIRVMGSKTGESEAPEPPTPPSGDAGPVIFAILAAISLAGIAIAKKAK